MAIHWKPPERGKPTEAELIRALDAERVQRLLADGANPALVELVWGNPSAVGGQLR